ncbi:MAG TPA: flagellar protein FliS [Mobilitalea sp.]|nr:flagellar protein FliS [Mobilitalea sp.]
MNKEAIRAFTARITQASRSELVVILYEITLAKIEEAVKAFNENNPDEYERELKGAHKCVNELMACLDYRYKISYDLMSLYIYVSKQIITALMKHDPKTLQYAKTVLQKLQAGFEEVSKTDNSGPMMKNTQQLYAGLTYGKGTLNETYINPNNKSRGFIA